MTATQEIRATLESAFPAVDFRVRAGSYTRGTNDGKPIVEVSYNFKSFPVQPSEIQAHLPKNATLWAVGL